MTAPSLSTADSGLVQNTVKTVFDQTVYFAYRANNVYRRAADIQRSLSQVPMPGNVITFTLINALAVATSALSETTEPTPVGMGVTQPTVTLVEYGNVVKWTRKGQLTSFLAFDPNIAREVSANMEESVDIVARDVMVAGTNVIYAGGRTARNQITTADLMTGNMARRARTFLAGKNTPAVNGLGVGSGYLGFIHPDVSYDFQGETGQGAWSYPHANVDTENIYSGTIGRFAGVDWMENANAKLFADAGSPGTVDVYATLVVGQQFLGEGVGDAQHIVIGPKTDDLMRFQPVGWYGLLGFGRVRENSAVRIESASSIGAN